MELILPTRDHLPPYVAALERGWSADNVRKEVAAREELAKIASDPQGFLDGHEDPQAAGGPVTLPDGSKVARLPGMNACNVVAFCGMGPKACGVGSRYRRSRSRRARASIHGACSMVS